MAGLNGKYVGYVVDNKDPQKAGHCRVRVEHLMTNMEDDVLPWAKLHPLLPSQGMVRGLSQFLRLVSECSLHSRVVQSSTLSIAHTAMWIQTLLRRLVTTTWTVQVLMYDKTNEVYVLFQPNRGLHLQYKGSEIQLSPDGMISIIHANNQSAIQLSVTR